MNCIDELYFEDLMNCIDELYFEDLRKMRINKEGLKDTLKILGGVIKDTLDVGDYRITLIVERKIDDKNGIIEENIVIEKRLSASQIEIITQRLKDVLNRVNEIR